MGREQGVRFVCFGWRRVHANLVAKNCAAAPRHHAGPGRRSLPSTSPALPLPQLLPVPASRYSLFLLSYNADVNAQQARTTMSSSASTSPSSSRTRSSTSVSPATPMSRHTQRARYGHPISPPRSPSSKSRQSRSPTRGPPTSRQRMTLRLS